MKTVLHWKCSKACQRCKLWLNLQHMKIWSCAFSAIMLSMCICQVSLDPAGVDQVLFLCPFSAYPNVFLHSSKFKLRYASAPQWLTKLISLKYKAFKLLLCLCLCLSSLCGVGISQHRPVLNKLAGVLFFPFVAVFLLLATGGRWLLSLHYLHLCLWGLLWFILKSVGRLSLALVAPALSGWSLLVNIIFTDIVLRCQH